VRPSRYLSLLVRKLGIRKLMRQGLGRRILQKISHRQLVKVSSLHEYERAIEHYMHTRRRIKRTPV
jgi:hypothetical protein